MTIEDLKKDIETLTRQRDEGITQVQMTNGALQYAQHLLKQLEDSAVSKQDSPASPVVD